MCLKKKRSNSFNKYGLCPSHYLSAPGLSCDAMLKMTKIELELILYPDVFILFVNGTRSGSSYISNRYTEANKKYLKLYDPKEEAKHFSYLQTRMIYMLMPSLIFFQQVDSNR